MCTGLDNWRAEFWQPLGECGCQLFPDHRVGSMPSWIAAGCLDEAWMYILLSPPAPSSVGKKCGNWTRKNPLLLKVPIPLPLRSLGFSNIHSVDIWSVFSVLLAPLLALWLPGKQQQSSQWGPTVSKEKTSHCKCSLGVFPDISKGF